MPDKEKLEVLIAREVETLEISLQAKAMRSAITLDEYIQIRTIQGASKAAIKADLLTDLAEGGRIFGEFRRSIKATANASINRTRDNAFFAEEGTDIKYRWVAVLINTCPDCMDRHGKIKTWEAWENDGLPRTGHTVCKEHCKCMLVPADHTEIEPIKRKKK